MTQAQKIIKYCATLFAVFLVITIISALLSGGYIVLRACGFIHDNETVIVENLETISSDVNSISSLEIDLTFTNLEIKNGNTFNVETNNSKITYKNYNGNLKIEEKNRNWFSGGKPNIDSSLILYIPEDMANMDEIKIEGGAGRITIEKLNTRDLELELGAGDVHIENLITSRETKIEGGAGKVELKSCEINNLEADLGMGEFSFSGKLTGRSKINSGVGSVNIEVMDLQDNYTIKADKGIGNVTLNGQNIDSNRIFGTGTNYLDIDGGIGNIKINFMN